jgi:hypothetical protein
MSVMVPNSQQSEWGFIPETGLCAATFSAILWLEPDKG